MYCSNCGKQVEEKDASCHTCGHQLHTDTQSEEDAATLENIEEENNHLNDDMKQFVGKKWDYYNGKWEKMERKGNGTSFNIAAFFLTIFWLGYRKMYKVVFLIAILFLASDVLLYLIGYQYDFNGLVDPVDRSISTATAVVLGLYGNHLYKKHAQKQLQIIQETNNDAADKERLMKKKGGKSWLGVLFALLILVGVYIIPTQFIPMNFNDVDIVKSTEFYDYPDVTIDQMFDDLFKDGSWNHVESTEDYEIVEFTGEKQLDYDSERHDVTIQFALDEDSYETEVTFVAIDGEELDMFESNQFIADIFEEHKDL